MLKLLKSYVSQKAVWPPIEAELDDVRGYLKGMVLNAGSGWRDVSHLISGTLVNQDISWPGDTRTNIDIVSPLDHIPRPDCTFDSVLCIAVLEHVEYPQKVVAELFRVTRLGGHLVASVPFLQPEHKVPTDFQRYTKDGLTTLIRDAGYEILEVKPFYTVWHTFHWLVYEWLHIKNTLLYKALRILLLPPLVIAARRSTLVSDRVASVFRIVARRPMN